MNQNAEQLYNHYRKNMASEVARANRILNGKLPLTINLDEDELDYNCEDGHLYCHISGIDWCALENKFDFYIKISPWHDGLRVFRWCGGGCR